MFLGAHMKLIINPTKTLYLENKKDLRLGNFPLTGKSIECDDDKISEFFRGLIEPMEKNEIIKLFSKICKQSLEFAEQSIDYLIDESILIDYDHYLNILDNQKFNRQLLYFYMLSNKDLSINLKTLSSKRVLILGIGGIGAAVAEQLVRAGFTNITILDCDCVEESNLIRQTTYFFDDIGKPKVECLHNYLKRINNDVSVNTCFKEVKEESDLDTLVQTSDFVFSSLDKPVRKIRRLVNKVCIKYNKPVLFAGFAEHVGMVGPFIIPHKTACLNCINQSENLDQPFNNVKYIPSFGPLCGTIAALASNEIINYFLKFKKASLRNKTLMIDLINYKTTKKIWHIKQTCEVCGGNHVSSKHF